MDLAAELNSLSATEAERCLNIMLRGLVEDPATKFEALVAADRELPEALSEVVQELGLGSGPTAEPLPGSPQRETAVRALLEGLGQDPRYAARVASAVTRARQPSLPGLLLTSLVVAGIIALLSVEFEVNHEVKDGKRTTKVHIKKKATAPELLKPFLQMLK